jgi:hypothetical protein
MKNREDESDVFDRKFTNLKKKDATKASKFNKNTVAMPLQNFVFTPVKIFNYLFLKAIFK